MKQSKTEYMDKELLAKRLKGELPKIDIAGHPFIIDWRLKELRPVDDLSTRIDLRNMPLTADGEHYLCFYHIPSKSTVKISDTITELPKDIVMLEIPYELKLDPVGVAREYGLEDTYMLDKYPIQSELKAKVIALEETGLPEIVSENKARQNNRKTAQKPLKRRKGL